VSTSIGFGGHPPGDALHPSRMKNRVRLRDLTHRLRMESLLRVRALATSDRDAGGVSPGPVAGGWALREGDLPFPSQEPDTDPTETP
jgi:hypothetical protein